MQALKSQTSWYQSGKGRKLIPEGITIKIPITIIPTLGYSRSIKPFAWKILLTITQGSITGKGKEPGGSCIVHFLSLYRVFSL
jgi:hypothetical protein